MKVVCIKTTDPTWLAKARKVAKRGSLYTLRYSLSGKRDEVEK